MTVVVAHVPVEEVVVVPANNARVRPNPDEATVDMLGGDGVKGAPDIEEGGQAMGPGINVALNVVNKGRGGSLSRAITSEPMLLGVEGVKPDALVNMPGAKPLKCLQEVVGEGDRAVGGRLGVCIFARLGEENHRTLLPEAGVSGGPEFRAI